MKKYLILFLTLILSGCSVVRINTNNLDTIIDVVLSKNNSLYNRDGRGYKYYIPNGVTHIDTDDLTHTLYYNGEYLYLYVDIVSYYYNKDIKFKKNDYAYYSRKLNLDNKKKKGYVEVIKKDDLYYVNFYYNYARIEALVTEEDLNNTILNATYILSTIKYNKGLIKTMLDDEYLINKAGKYDLFKTNDKTEKFILQKDKEGE